MRQKLEAEAALLDSYIKVARKQAEFEHVAALPQSGPPKQIPYKPQVQGAPSKHRRHRLI